MSIRKEVIGDATLYCGDCFEVAPEQCADVIISDPPYGCTYNVWDKKLELEAFWQLCGTVAGENSLVILFCAGKFAVELAHSNFSHYLYDLIWIKPRPSDFLNSNHKPLRGHENILLFGKWQNNYTPQLVRVGGSNRRTVRERKSFSANYHNKLYSFTYTDKSFRKPTTVLDLGVEPEFHRKGNDSHPTRKPVRVLEWLVRSYTLHGQAVCDPFMGSGSTGVAALRAGRKFVGIEMDEHWFDVACRRIEAAWHETALIRAARPAPEPSATATSSRGSKTSSCWRGAWRRRGKSIRRGVKGRLKRSRSSARNITNWGAPWPMRRRTASLTRRWTWRQPPCGL